MPALLGLFLSFLAFIGVVFLVVGLLSIPIKLILWILNFDISAGFDNEMLLPANFFLGKLYDLITAFFPSFDTLFTQIENAMNHSSEDSPFIPAMTVSGLLNTLGFKECFNALVTAYLNGLTFLIVIKFLRFKLSSFLPRNFKF